MNSFLIYLGLFLVIGFTLYCLVPKKYRYLVLLILSVAFNFIYNSLSGIYILITSISVYLLGLYKLKEDENRKKLVSNLSLSERKIINKKSRQKQKIMLTVIISLNLMILFVLKYFNFVSSIIVDKPLIKIILPLGISYYTLMAISYAIDIINGKYQANRNPFKVMLYICYFPSLLEGPINRFDEIIDDLTKGEVKTSNIWQGLYRIVFGLFKILIVANRLGMIVSEGFKNEYYGLNIVILALSFTLQLYCEFSGYIDVTLGVSKVFGITLSENFDRPFISQNVSEFWRRWHISLGRFFKDYVYFPFTMTNKAMKLTLNNTTLGKIMRFFYFSSVLFLIWFLTGLWHGASVKYIVYGLYYFLIMIMEQILAKPCKLLLTKLNISSDNRFIVLLNQSRTFILVMIGMLLFRTSDLTNFIHLMNNLFVFDNSFSLLNAIDYQEMIVLIMGIIVLIISLLFKRYQFSNYVINQQYVIKFSCVVIFVIIIIIFGVYGKGYLPPDPIYGGF